MSRFPHLPETFILREMIALEHLGWQVSLYPLIFQKQSVIHADARAWLERAQRLPWFSLEVLRANLRRFFKQPGLYLSVLFQVMGENLGSLKFLARALVLFPKIVLMAERIESEGIRHIHAHYATHPGLAAWVIHRFTGITYSVTVHAHDIYVEKAMLGTKLKEATFIAAISEYNINYLARHVGEWIRERAHVIRCGIDPALYHPAEQSDPDRSRLNIVSVGSLQPYKGHIHLIDACALLHQRGVPFHCQIIGGGDLKPALEKRIHQHGLQGLVELVGPKTQEEIARLLDQANCYVQPSVIMPSGKMEGIPVALMEAMASGLPVVATDISGVPELVREGETGWLVPPESPQALADVLTEIYTHPEQAAQRAQAGRQWVLQEFTLASNVRKLSDLLTPLASSPEQA
ncbi:MAG: glycosyltransferase family 4 protein [Anaerolineae bacterium]